MDDFIKDCFANIDETPLSNLVDHETIIKFKLVGLKTIITRYCSPSVCLRRSHLCLSYNLWVSK